MQQEIESLSNLVGLLLWQREEFETTGEAPGGAELEAGLAEWHGLTSRAGSTMGPLSPGPGSLAATPRGAGRGSVDAGGFGGEARVVSTGVSPRGDRGDDLAGAFASGGAGVSVQGLLQRSAPRVEAGPA